MLPCRHSAAQCSAVQILEALRSLVAVAVAVAFRPIVRPPSTPHPALPPAIAVPSADQEFLVPSPGNWIGARLPCACSLNPTHEPLHMCCGLQRDSLGKHRYNAAHYALTPANGPLHLDILSQYSPSIAAYTLLKLLPPVRHSFGNDLSERPLPEF